MISLHCQASLSLSLSQGITLTDAKVGSAFAVVSGHDVEGTDWSAFSSIPTLVILMAGRRVGCFIAPLLLIALISCLSQSHVIYVLYWPFHRKVLRLTRITKYTKLACNPVLDRGLPKIVDKLLAASSRQGSEREAEAGPEPTNDKVGWEPGTPVAVVRSAGLPQQRVWYSTLSAVALATSGEELSPCVVVIGKVVGLRDAWRGAEEP